MLRLSSLAYVSVQGLCFVASTRLGVPGHNPGRNRLCRDKMTGMKSWVGRTNEASEPADEVGFMKKPPAGLHLGECGSLPGKDGKEGCSR